MAGETVVCLVLFKNSWKPFSAMIDASDLGALKETPIKWPKASLVFSFGDVFFKLEKDRKYRDNKTYAISIVVYSKRLAQFLDSAAKMKGDISTCPRIRRVPGTSDIGVFGQSWWIVLKPGTNEAMDPSSRVDWEVYKPGARLVSLGKSVLLEANLVSFVLNAVDTLKKNDGLLKAQMRDGFISISCAGFDFFYGFVYACYKAGKSHGECRDLIQSGGVPMQYPQTFDLDNISERDIGVLYDLLAPIITDK